MTAERAPLRPTIALALALPAGLVLLVAGARTAGWAEHGRRAQRVDQRECKSRRKAGTEGSLPPPDRGRLVRDGWNRQTS